VSRNRPETCHGLGCGDQVAEPVCGVDLRHVVDVSAAAIAINADLVQDEVECALMRVMSDASVV
jgi:hypothetical protein